MFDTGTQVIILSSSFSGKTGPKRGSIGYIADIEVSDTKIYFDQEMSWFARHHLINFVRYGFEKNSRLESKFFISLTPNITLDDVNEVNRNNSKTTMSDIVSKRITEISEFDPSELRFYDELRNMVASKYGKEHVHIGMVSVLPTNLNLIETDPINFYAWVECFMKDLYFQELVDNMMVEIGRISKALDPASLELIRRMILQKAERSDILLSAIKNQDIRKDIINIIRKITTIGGRPLKKKLVESNRNYIIGHIINTRNREAVVMKMIIDSIFSAECVDYMKLVIAQGSKVMIKKMEFLSEMSNRMVSLARSLEDGVEVIQQQTVNN